LDVVYHYHEARRHRMAEDNYSVKINRRDGAVEITGGDKAWIAEQLDKLAVVYTAELPTESNAGIEDSTTNGGNAGGTGTGTKRRRSRSKGGGGGSRARNAGPSQVTEKLDAGARKKLEAYVAARDFKGTQKQAAIIAGFLQDELKFDGIDAADLTAVYDVMGWRKPVNPRAVINNARTRDGYFRGWVGGKTHLSAGGENFARIDSKKKAEAES
jgi:hypothetical protein